MLWTRVLILPLSLLVDRVVGDPRSRYHPVALLGRFIGWWGRPGRYNSQVQRTAGVIGWVATVVLFSLPFLATACTVNCLMRWLHISISSWISLPASRTD